MGKKLGEREILFTHDGRDKLRDNIRANGVDAQAVQEIPNILRRGKYLGSRPDTKAHEQFRAFHTFYKKLTVNGEAVRAIVDVGERKNGEMVFNFYSLNHEGSKSFRNRERMLKAEFPVYKKIAGDSAIFAGFKPGVTMAQTSAVPEDPARVIGRDSRISRGWSPGIESIIVVYDDGVNISMQTRLPNRCSFALDAASARQKDENGFLHVAASDISKETVNPYYGREIPGWQEEGLDGDKIYNSYRAGEELKKAASTFNGLPLLLGHHPESASSR